MRTFGPVPQVSRRRGGPCRSALAAPITGGGTHAAYAALSGKPVIESLGLPGFGYHSTSAEYVYLDAIAPRLYLTSKMIMELGR